MLFFLNLYIILNKYIYIIFFVLGSQDIVVDAYKNNNNQGNVAPFSSTNIMSVMDTKQPSTDNNPFGNKKHSKHNTDIINTTNSNEPYSIVQTTVEPKAVLQTIEENHSFTAEIGAEKGSEEATEPRNNPAANLASSNHFAESGESGDGLSKNSFVSRVSPSKMAPQQQSGISASVSPTHKNLCKTSAKSPIMPKTLALSAPKPSSPTISPDISKGGHAMTYQIQAQVHPPSSYQSSLQSKKNHQPPPYQGIGSLQSQGLSSYHFLDQTNNCILEHDELAEMASLTESASSSSFQKQNHPSSNNLHGNFLQCSNPSSQPHSPHPSISPTPSYGNSNMYSSPHGGTSNSSHAMGSSLTPGNPHPANTSPHSTGSFQGSGSHVGSLSSASPYGGQNANLSTLNGDLTPRGHSRGDLCDERSPKSSISHLSLRSPSFPCR